MNKKGIFITFEGGEGAGKSTQSRFLYEYLTQKNYAVLLTREPGGTPEAEKIRHLLVDRNGGNWSALEETLLFFTARLNHITHKIKPALARGEIVICDRFTDSTIAYQCYGRGVDLNLVQKLKSEILNDFDPDLTFLFDLPIDVGLARSSKRAAQTGSTEDRFENLNLEFHEKMRNGFLELSKQNPDRFSIIDATKSVSDISAELISVLNSRGI